MNAEADTQAISDNAEPSATPPDTSLTSPAAAMADSRSLPSASPTPNAEADFQALLDNAEASANPKPGELLTGHVAEIDDSKGMTINLGLKHDGFVPKETLAKLRKKHATFEVGQEVQVALKSTAETDGYWLVEVKLPDRFKEDWDRALEMKASGAMWEGEVLDYNKGGLLIKFGNLQGFVPTSHLASLPRDNQPVDRAAGLANWKGRTLGFKVIEVDPQKRRLVLSQREANREFKAKLKGKIMADLVEGQVRQGLVTGLREFGAFVDLGGADGLIHVSEISWHHIKHPSEVLKVGQTVEVEVVKIDPATKRIGLSLKRRQPDPWSVVPEQYPVGQVFTGRVARLTPFGAFIALAENIDGLIHTSRLADQPTLATGDEVSVRILNVDPSRQRISLELVDPFSEDL